MRFRRVIVPAVLAAAALVPASSVAAPAPTTSVQIAAQARFNNQASIVVTVTVQCSPLVFGGPLYSSTFVSVFVSQTETLAIGSGLVPVVPCDNQKHPVAVEVTGGPFNLGKASASASACGFTCANDVRQITIVT
jgi:hypothetical protein